MNKQKDTDTKTGEHVSEAIPKYTQDAYGNIPEDTIIEPVPGKRYTYSDYLTWNDGKRYELIDGVPMVMEAPNRQHQKISRKLMLEIGIFLKDKPCEEYAAPFDVRLNADEADNITVQPDIVVICDHSKLTDAGCSGAPDFVIEILSPGTARHDRLVKMHLYEKAGIREYWIVDPESKMVTTHILDGDRYYLKAYGEADTVSVYVLEGCMINLADIFAET